MHPPLVWSCTSIVCRWNLLQVVAKLKHRPMAVKHQTSWNDAVCRNYLLPNLINSIPFLFSVSSVFRRNSPFYFKVRLNIATVILTAEFVLVVASPISDACRSVGQHAHQLPPTMGRGWRNNDGRCFAGNTSGVVSSSGKWHIRPEKAARELSTYRRSERDRGFQGRKNGWQWSSPKPKESFWQKASDPLLSFCRGVWTGTAERKHSVWKRLGPKLSVWDRLGCKVKDATPDPQFVWMW